jgi:hypothetical protein
MLGNCAQGAIQIQPASLRLGPGKKPVERLFLQAITSIVLGLGLATTAQAQFVCGGSTDGSEPQGGAGATGAGSTANVACGSQANASGGVDSDNVAMGFAANASGVTSSNVGLGAFADASGSGSTNTAIGGASRANGDRSNNVATGEAFASGNGSNNIASGFVADARGDGSSNIAIGDHAVASGNATKNTAVGSNSVAGGNNASAFGAGAQAPFVNSAAFGAGATATRANQQVFGTSTNTYTLPGVTSAASAAAQSGPTQVVTTDASGNLASVPIASLGLGSAADITALNQKLRKSFTGVAMAFAMTGVPTVLPNEKFVLSANWGTFQGENGAALSGAVRIYHNMQLQASFAYGFRENMAGGHAGLRFGF